MKTTTLVSFTFLSFLLCCSACKNVNTKKKEEVIRLNRVDSIMGVAFERRLFNGNMLIAKADTVLYQKSYGFTDASKEKKLERTSIFNIGSIAKEINAVALLILMEDGALSLDDPISKFDLGLPKWSEKVTVHHLLNYAAGLPQPQDSYLKDDETAFQSLRRLDSLLFAPGSNFNYNNYSVFLQQRIVEKVSKMRYTTFVEERMLKPLGIQNAVFDPDPSVRNRTSCYDLDGTPCPEMEYISGWLWMDINALFRWTKGLKNNLLLSDESFKILQKNPYPNGATSSIGEYFEDAAVLRHNGTSFKFRSMMLNDFKNDFTLILLDNNGGLALELGHMLHNIALEKDFELPKKSLYQHLRKQFLKDLNKGIATYKQLQKNNKEEYDFENPNALVRLGYVLLREGSLEEAVTVFELGVSEFPDHANGYDSLGEGYLMVKNYELALQNYKKAIALGGTNGNAKRMVQTINNTINKK